MKIIIRETGHVPLLVRLWVMVAKKGGGQMKLTPREWEMAKRAASRLLQAQQQEATCSRCHGQGQLESGVAIDGYESCGGGHACFAPCPDCAGTGRGEGV